VSTETALLGRSVPLHPKELMDTIEKRRIIGVAERWRIRDALQEALVDCVRVLRERGVPPTSERFAVEPCREHLSTLVRAYAASLRASGVRLPDILPEVYKSLAGVLRAANTPPELEQTLMRWCTEAYVGAR
jgi:hypothetical protein